MNGDLISRKWLMECVEEGWIKFDTEKDTNKYIHLIRDITPSVQQERKKGEWIPEFDGRFTGGAFWFSCSKCKRIVPEVRNGGWNYCPNCGAEMKGEEE